MQEFKRSGYEVLDLRLGGISARVEHAIGQIKDYLEGEITEIEEMEETRLSFNNKSEEELERDPVMCWCYRRDLFTPNRLVW